MNKKISMIVALTLLAVGSALAQAESKPSCNPQACGPAGTKTEEAKAITGMRSDLQAVLTKLATTNVGVNEQLTGTEISKGSTDDESLLFIYQSAFSVHSELVSKVPSDKILPELKNHDLQPSANKQELVATLKKEIKLLNKQVERL
jgi:hypothetical protein